MGRLTMADKPITYARQQRLRMIDFLLAQYGHVNRSAIMDFFDISMPQVSLDFQLYQALAPENMAYDLSQRRYVKGPNFKRFYP